MSIQKTNSTPNVYKLEKFVIIDTRDSFNLTKLHRTKPNTLICRKVYTAYDRNDQKNEFIDTATIYEVAVPLSVWQVDAYTSAEIENGSNSLICPPYIASNANNLKPDKTLAEHLEAKADQHALVHRGSIIYAQKRDGGIDILGGNQSGQPLERWIDTVVDYVDINADGRSMKISSQTDKSNNIDLTDSNIDNLSNLYNANSESLGIIQNGLVKACITNEDAGIDYITELDQVAKEWRHAVGEGSPADYTAPKDSATQYALIFDHDAGSNGHYPVLKFQEVTGGGGGGVTTFAALTDTDPLTDQEGKLLEVNSSANKIVYSNLKASHIDTTDVAATSYFLTSSGAAGSSNTLELKTINEIFDDGYASAADDIDFGENHYVLVVDTDTAANTKFRRIKYIHQLGGVSIDSSVKHSLNTAEGEDGHKSSVKTVAVVSKDGSAAKYKVRFDEMGDLISDTSGDQLGTGSNVIGDYYVVRNGTDGLQGVKLGADLFSGGGGDGSVRYVDGADNTPGALQLKRGDTYGGVNYLAYEPKLFGICKENGDYEYRYFLTSVPVTT